MATDSSSPLLWTLILIVTALSLALVVCFHILSTYTSAYLVAPREITTFIDVVDFSIQENESYDRDVARVQRLEDKLRLGRLLREIQKSGDDLREDLNRLLAGEGSTLMRSSARFLWASHRQQLEERVRRLDMLRMRFLVVYMGVITTTAGEREKIAERSIPKDTEKASVQRHQSPPAPPPLPKSLTDSIKRRPPLMKLKTQAMGHSEKTEQPHRMGWMGVVQELQRSPLMRQRHASIEEAMRSPPISPISSPLGSSVVDIPPMRLKDHL
jgi:hypothetical protein